MTPEKHPWMGRPLASYPDAELWLILAALEQVAGRRHPDCERLFRFELIEAIAALDTELAEKRSGCAVRPMAAGEARAAA